jgi:hypothetical protein
MPVNRKELASSRSNSARSIATDPQPTSSSRRPSLGSPRALRMAEA